MASPAALEDLTWSEDAQDRIEAWAKSGLTFSSDDLRESFRQAPRGSMVGRAFTLAKERGIIQKNGSKMSTTRSRKGALINTWRGVNEGVSQ